MSSYIEFNREVFLEKFSDLDIAFTSVREILGDDPREACLLATFDPIAKWIKDIMEAADSGKKFLWLGISNPSLFMGFENVFPYGMELAFGIYEFLDPAGAEPFMDLGAEKGISQEFCALDRGFLGYCLAGGSPPCHMIGVPMTPCDSMTSGHQALSKLINAPIVYWDVPYTQDKAALEVVKHHLWKSIKTIEENLKTRMDWDKCREHIKLSNQMNEYLIGENEMRKHRPCPHPGKLGTAQVFLYYTVAGNQGAADAAKYVYEDSKKLVAAGKGALEKERARLLWYYPDPIHDLGLHDWIEDEYNCITVLTMFGHHLCQEIDTSTPDSIIEGYAWNMMNMVMSRQFRGPVEYLTDLMAQNIDDYGVDAVVFPLAVPCKHGQAAKGFVQDLCEKKGMPLLLLEYDPMDARPFPSEAIREKVVEFLEVQVLPYV